MNARASKVFYRPIEASIRWAGLLRYERDILACVRTPRSLPRSMDYPRWHELRLYTARIYDGIVNGELPFGRNGITTSDIQLIDSPDLTVRHVNLKRWMRQHYPEHRPRFLFSRSERITHPLITLETGNALLVERSALKATLKQYRSELQELQVKHDALLTQTATASTDPHEAISHRAEATYLNIIGAMLELMLGHSPSGTPYSSFRTQDAIVSAMVAHRGDVMGISERTLNGKFARARRRLPNAPG